MHFKLKGVIFMNYGWLSLLPPIIAIVLALVTKEVLLSLFIAVFAGATIVAGGNLLTGFTQTLNHYVVGALNSEWNISIMIFCLCIGGLIGILNRNGGTKGIGNAIVKRAKSSKSSLMTSWALGMLIFFDDYANSLIVGSTMRPITDRLNVPREKLAFIVDSTAAPVSSIAFISTWVGMEMGLIRDGVAGIGLNLEPFGLYLQTIPYRFYSLLILFFVVMVILTGRDFGPMAKAEKRARLTGKVLDDDAVPMVSDAEMDFDDVEGKERWYNAVVPIMTVILVTLVGLFINGGGLEGASLTEAFGSADASVVLLWSSFTGVIIAGIMSMGQRILNLKQVTDAWVAGVKSMTVAVLILTLAWSLGKVNGELGTASFIANIAQDSLPAFLLPLLMFIVPGLIAFATGTSWGANSIVMPIAIPLAFQIGGEAMLVPTMGAVLTGAVLGDHCSPVSDTTIMSSMATACDHIAHVKTQMPYAMTVGAVAIVVGFIPAGLGMSPWISLVLGVAALYTILRVFGVKNEEISVSESEQTVNGIKAEY